MYGDFSEKLAKLVVQYAVNVQKGDRVQLKGAANAEDLIRDIYREIIKAGGHTVKLDIGFSGFQEIFFKYATEDQIKYVDEIGFEHVKKLTKAIFIFSSYNTRSLTNIDPKLLVMQRNAGKELNEIFKKRAAAGEIDWNICPYPNLAMAQEASMGIEEYKEFVYKALALDKPDPVKFWNKMEANQNEIVKILDKGKEIRIIGEDTDLSLGIVGRKWINSCGHKNLPDGEVFTSPIEDSVNGTIRFTYPGIYMGREVENIWLKFKDGQVIDCDAAKGKDILNNVLELENAKILGELAVGTNYGIQRFTKNMLFDEKIGGTIHLALGSGFPEAGSKNKSPIHWDILKDMKSKDSKIILDGEEIYKAGKWLIPK